MPAIPFDAMLHAIQNAANAGAFGFGKQTHPTEAQLLAGNYAKGRVSWNGLTLVIEQPRGTYREGKGWRTLMASHYGYIAGTRGNDGDEVDCFIGSFVDSTRVYVVNQVLRGRFDEHKVMLCYDSEEAARDAYMRSYSRGWAGLDSVAALSLSQFKWWLKNGDLTKPLSAENLPYEGTEPMKRVYWTADAEPIGQSLDTLLYGLRQHDGAAGLLLDSVSVADIHSDPENEAVLTMDAMVTPFNKLQPKMNVLHAVMGRTGSEVKPVAVQVSDPFKQRGTVNVAAVFELSDGQTVTVYFHNPDSTPAKLAPGDELISWKWMLNKKDVTIVVAPERGQDLNIREVARRLMRLAEKNSPAFQRANAKRSERMAAIQSLTDEVAGLEATLASEQNRLEVLKEQAQARAEEAAKPKPFVAYLRRDGDGAKGVEGVGYTDIGSARDALDEMDRPVGANYVFVVADSSIRFSAAAQLQMLKSTQRTDRAQFEKLMQVVQRWANKEVGTSSAEWLRQYAPQFLALYHGIDLEWAQKATAQWLLGDAGMAEMKFPGDPVESASEPYDFKNALSGFDKWIEANAAMHATAVAMDKAAIAAGARVQWFKPGAAMDSAYSMDSGMAHAIAALAITGSIAANNAPIQAAAGDADQAALSHEVAMSAEEAAEVLERYEAGELVAITRMTMDAGGGAQPCGAILVGSVTVGVIDIDSEGAAMAYADAQATKPVHQARLSGEDAAQLVTLALAAGTKKNEATFPGGVTDKEMAVLLVTAGYKAAYRAKTAYDVTGMSADSYAATVKSLNDAGKYLKRSAITPAGMKVVKAFLPEISTMSSSKLEYYFRGKFSGEPEAVPADDPVPAQPTFAVGDYLTALFPSLNKQPSIEAYKERPSGNTSLGKVEKVLSLTADEYDDFANNLLANNPALGDGGSASDHPLITDELFKRSLSDWTPELQAIWRKTSYVLVTVVQAPGRETFVVDSQGYDYARYVGLNPKPAAAPMVPAATAKADPIEVDDYQKLAGFTKVRITSIGNENLYFATEDGVEYYTKLVEPDDYAVDQWVSMADDRAVKEALKPAVAAEYRYALMYRPAGPGATPSDGFLRVEPAPESIASTARHGVAVYSRELSDDELKQFEMRRVRTDTERAEAVSSVAQAMVAHEYAANYYEYLANGERNLLEMTMREQFQERYPFDVFPDAQAMEAEAASQFEEAMKTKMPAPKTVDTDSTDAAILRAIVDGTTDPLTADLEALEAIYERNADNAEIQALFEQAVNVVIEAENKATASV